ncbi:hypothetical protein LCGC14_2960020, partial [marine sediment metagenome]
KNFIIKQDICGYILVFDVKMTEVDTKGKKKPKVVDAVIRTLYTPKEKVMEIVKYKNKRILKTMKIGVKDVKKMKDEWDLWRPGVDEDEMIKAGFDYGEFKRKNPELYDGVIDQFDDYKQFRDEDGRLVMAYKIDDKEETFRYYVPDDASGKEKAAIKEGIKQIKELGKRLNLNYKIIREVKK